MEKAYKDLTTLDNSCGRNVMAIGCSPNIPTEPRTVSITYLSTVLSGGPGQSHLCTVAVEREREETGQVT